MGKMIGCGFGYHGFYQDAERVQSAVSRGIWVGVDGSAFATSCISVDELCRDGVHEGVGFLSRGERMRLHILRLEEVVADPA